MPSFVRNMASQANNWHSVLQQQTKCHIIQNLGYSKVYTRQIPRSLTVEFETDRKASSSELLAYADAFLSQILTADKT
jgi:hypothetical protein